jgi:hypothetical protein
MSRSIRTLPFLLLAMLAASAAGAQGAPAQGAPAQGFSAQAFLAELSLFLPPELLRSAVGRGPGAASRAGRPQLQFTRDPKLYLTKEQVDQVRPLAEGLKDSPMPSPAKARQLRAELDAILTPEQKAEYADYRQAIAKFRAEMQKQRSAAGQPGPQLQGAGDQPRGAPDQARQGTSDLQRRQRMVEAFLKALADYRRQLG